MHSLQCKIPRDVLILLKSSVILNADIELSLNLSLPPVLNLVRYHSLNESMIFRCFIKNKTFIAMSQKEISSFYGYLAALKDAILENSHSFVDNAIMQCPLHNFTMDIYIDIPPNYKIYILGFNSFSESTSPCLFT